jgi:hypothetical protein
MNGHDLERLADLLRSTDTSTGCDVALELADIGIPVLPTVPGEKAPLLTARHIRGVDPRTGEKVGEACPSCETVGLTPAGDHGATTDADLIRRYWSAHPDAGVGMKNHPRLVRGDGDHANAAAIKKAHKAIGYGQPGGVPHPFTARTPGGQYRRRYLHYVPNGDVVGGGVVTVAGVQWYVDHGYVVVKGGHPSGTDYSPFIGEQITPVPAVVAAALATKAGSGDSAPAATSATVSSFLDQWTGTTKLSALDRHRRYVETAREGERHHAGTAALRIGFREAVAGWYPARLAHDVIRSALATAGWTVDRFDAEWADMVAYAVGQCDALTPDTAAAEITDRAADARANALEAGYPSGYVDTLTDPNLARDLTADELDNLTNATGDDLGDELGDGLPTPVDWHTLFARESTTEWLIEDIWPLGRQIHIFAARKTGKSLVLLWCAACLAVGRDPFTGSQRPPMKVAYLDYEMTEDDLLERLEEMGFTADQLAGSLLYYLWPTLPPMDTDRGGMEVVRLLERDQAEVVIIDTLSRVVEGEENSADTYREFFLYTGMRLKRRGISMARLDHEGHEGGRSRGSSAKADDVDVVWQLKTTDDGLIFVRHASRMSWVPSKVPLAVDDPLQYRKAAQSWPAGTATKARELDAARVPLDASKRRARELLKASGATPGKNDVLMAALRYRRQRLPVDGLKAS